MDVVIFEARWTIFKSEIGKLEKALMEKPPVKETCEELYEPLPEMYEETLYAMNKALEAYSADEEKDYSADIQSLEERRFEAMTKIKRVSNKILKMFPKDSQSQAPVVMSHRPNLPPRQLVKFNGDVREWLPFWASFEDIHDSKSIPEAEEMQHMLECIPKDFRAWKSVEDFANSPKNYLKAVEALKTTYGRDNMLIKVYVRDLLQLVIQNAASGVKTDFTDLYPRLSSHIRNLDTLGVTQDKCEALLYPVVESCLPEDVLVAWQRNPGFEEKLDKILEFLNKEVNNNMDRCLAKMQFTTASEGLQKKSFPRKDKEYQTPTAASFAVLERKSENRSGYHSKRGNEPCAFCGDSRHSSERCFKAKKEMTLEQKKEKLREKKICFKCLRPAAHLANKCSFGVKCMVCQGSHYEVMCPERSVVSRHSARGASMMNSLQTDQTPAFVYQQQYIPPSQQLISAQQQYVPPIQQHIPQVNNSYFRVNNNSIKLQRLNNQYRVEQ